MFSFPRRGCGTSGSSTTASSYHLFFLLRVQGAAGPRRPAPPGRRRARGVHRTWCTGSGCRRARALATRRPSTTCHLDRVGRRGTRTAPGSCSTRAPRSNDVGANVQSIGYAVSDRPLRLGQGAGPGAAADPRWYEKLRRRALARRGVPRPVGAAPTRTATAGTCSSRRAPTTGAVGRPRGRRARLVAGPAALGGAAAAVGAGAGLRAARGAAARRRRRPPGAALQLQGRRTCRRRRGPRV